MQSQGKRLTFQLKLNGSLDGIFSDLATSFEKGNVGSSSLVAADLISVGDSWLGYAIKKGMIQSIEGAEDQDWFKALSSRWKVRKQLLSYGHTFFCFFGCVPEGFLSEKKDKRLISPFSSSFNFVLLWYSIKILFYGVESYLGVSPLVRQSLDHHLLY